MALLLLMSVTWPPGVSCHHSKLLNSVARAQCLMLCLMWHKWGPHSAVLGQRQHKEQYIWIINLGGSCWHSLIRLRFKKKGVCVCSSVVRSKTSQEDYSWWRQGKAGRRSWERWDCLALRKEGSGRILPRCENTWWGLRAEEMLSDSSQ